MIAFIEKSDKLNLDSLLSAFCENVQLTCLVFGVLGFVIALCFRWKRASHHDLGPLFIVSLTASAIPVGALMLVCAFQTKHLKYLADMQSYLGLLGLSIIFVSVIEIKKWLRPDATNE